MKKIVNMLFVMCFAIFPMLINASEKINLEDYTTTNLKDTLESESIDLAFDNYEESDDQITIYMFRGKGCGYCKAFLNFLNNNAKEYGKYFKLVAFETWYDTNNSDLLTTISTFLNNQAQGVPYIIIGEQVFPGYSSDYDESILSAIKTLYDSEDRYDVFEAYNEKVKADSKASSGNTTTIVVWNLVFTVVALTIIVFYVGSSNKKILQVLSSNEAKPYDIMDDESKEDDKVLDNKEDETPIVETKKESNVTKTKKAKKNNKNNK